MRFTACCLCWLFLLCSFSQAAEIKSPGGLMVKNTVDYVLKTLQNPDIKIAGPRQKAMLDDIAEAIKKCIDFEEFSTRAIGSKWRSFTPKQQQEFIQAFTDWLYNIYLGSLLKYTGQPIEFIGEIISDKGDRMELRSTFLHENKPIPINYRLLQKGGQWRIYDIHIESFSIVQNYRQQFQEALQKQTPDEFIARIRAKADESRHAADPAVKK